MLRLRHIDAWANRVVMQGGNGALRTIRLIGAGGRGSAMDQRFRSAGGGGKANGRALIQRDTMTFSPAMTGSPACWVISSARPSGRALRNRSASPFFPL